MAGNARFDLTSASPDSGFSGNFQNGQRGYSASSLDRSTSFRDGIEGRNFSSGKANSRGSATSSGDASTLSQSLTLDPFVIDQKHAQFSDVRRVLGFVGSSSEDNSFGSAHIKNPSPTALEELKRLRASVADSSLKASSRAKRLEDNLNKLNKFETMSSKKQQQRNEMPTHERSSGSTLKIGSLMHRSTTEFASQKFDDRPKNGGLNKRLRTSVAETRAECRNNGVLRQPLTVTKERDLLKDRNGDSEMGEEKIRRLPAGGESWDKKMKRKRTFGTAFPRSVDNDGELKRTMHPKLNSESSLQSSDSTQSFRSGVSGGTNKLDSTSQPAGSSARATFKNEQEKSMLSRDGTVGPIKERTLGKLNVRINNREENHSICPSPILKGKASRTPRNGSMVAANSTSTTPRVSGTLESWEQPQALNRTPTISGANNRKRPMPAGSSSPPITQWGGQRPQKSSRTRRTNLIPVPNLDDVQMQAEGGSPSDFSPRLSTGTTSASFPTKSSGSGNQNSKAKAENVSSPARLSESEESGAGQFRTKEKGIGNADVDEKDGSAGPNIGSSTIPIKKNKIMVKEEIGDGVRRQGRSGRISPFSRGSISSTREKLDIVPPSKPLRNARSGSDKNGSKSGRPLKKQLDRKGVSRLGHGGSPDCSGESEDDHEELLAAAKLAWNSSVNACSSAFWKTVESLFGSIGPDEKSYLSDQLKLAEESYTNSHQNSSHGNHVQVKIDESGLEQIAAPESISFGRYRHMNNGTSLKTSSDRRPSVEQSQDSSVFDCADKEKPCEIVTPLYQRVLSALIEEDEIEESEETGYGMPIISVTDPCLLIGADSKHINQRDLCEPLFGVQTPKNGNHIFFSCNGNTDFTMGHGSGDHLSNGDLHQRDSGYVHSEVEVLVKLSRCDYVPEGPQIKNCGVASFRHQYEQMSFEEKLVLELQSIGLFVEAAPALGDKDEVINEEIVQLEKGLHEQIGQKKSYLDKISKVIEEGKDIGRRDPEQVAMDKLVELACKKLLATRGSFATKHGIPKVSKQVALAFARRTLARCQKFQDSGASCFSDLALRDVIFATPPRFNEAELLNGGSLAVANDGTSSDAFNTAVHQSDHSFAKNGPISNRAKRRELLLDDVGGAVFRASSALGIADGAKGKRSERDRNTVAKAGRSSMDGGSKGERKAKSKPKQKTAQLSTSANSFIYKFPDASNPSALESPNGNRRKDVRFMSSGNAPLVSSNEVKESMEFADLPMNDIVRDLGVDPEIGEPQDLNSWLNFDMDDGLQVDNDSIVGLDIPMDDLAELNMF
ncbi:uncharacterized protein LOC121765012 isoform X3 [Salvia splendens]|uniref:uncharacterized protein LOC121765012 isoform X3 n=1 Tax=Salvia splendens TaxID=180675 RepID=UPI001C25EDFB|nr:uncharacterized protein LOC121765012 isoform X3 [Salvia splendens]